MFEQRPGERALPFDPAIMEGDSHVVFIGRIHSPWKERSQCPRNMIQARAYGRERPPDLKLRISASPSITSSPRTITPIHVSMPNG